MLLKSNTNISMYPGLSSFNASLLLSMAIKLLSKNLCYVLLGFDEYFK